MEKVTYAGENQKKIELFQLGIYTIYCMIFIVMATEYKWDSWIGIFMLFGLASSWIVHIGKVKDYVFRAKFSAVMMQGTVLLYVIHLDELYRALPIFVVSVVLLGLYGLTDIISFTVVSAFFIFFYHGVIIKSISVGTIEQNVSVLLQF